jgi:hypothetical protein
MSLKWRMSRDLTSLDRSPGNSLMLREDEERQRLLAIPHAAFGCEPFTDDPFFILHDLS